ncbi:MAG: hypothetical protein RMN51_01420 [Verrucomicrobiota bacterium]|nr:hypothetical protein [Limisphaera sp.]MDW8380758.1 hypothetical protein [Verrucomicrobiota bacterium]
MTIQPSRPATLLAARGFFGNAFCKVDLALPHTSPIYRRTEA